MWTFAVGLSDDYNYPQLNCPCAKTPGPDPPTFVGSHYYCELANTGIFNGKHVILYTADPLWDGAGYLSNNGCCCKAEMPWFFRHFPISTTRVIKVRICHDQPFVDGSVMVEQVQLYVQ